VAGSADAGAGVAADPSEELTIARGLNRVGRVNLVPGLVGEVGVMAARALDLAVPEEVRDAGGSGDEPVDGPEVLGQVAVVIGAGAGREVGGKADRGKQSAAVPQTGPGGSVVLAAVLDGDRVVVREAGAVRAADVQPASSGVADLVVAGLSGLEHAVVLVERPACIGGRTDTAAAQAGLAGLVREVVKGGDAVVAAQAGESRAALVDVSWGAAYSGAVGGKCRSADRPVPQRSAAGSGSVVGRMTEHADLGRGVGGEEAGIRRVTERSEVMP